METRTHLHTHTHTHTQHRQKRWARARRNKLIVHTFNIFKFLERVTGFPLSLIFVFVFLFLFPFIFLPISLFGICIKSDDAEEMIPIHCTIRRDNPAFSGDPTDQMFLSFRHHWSPSLLVERRPTITKTKYQSHCWNLFETRTRCSKAHYARRRRTKVCLSTRFLFLLNGTINLCVKHNEKRTRL